MALMDTRYCLVGHTHVPLLHVDGNGRLGRARQVSLAGDAVSLRLGEDRLILNPGSVGQPRDGDPRAAFMLLDTETGEAEIRRIEYGITTTQERILHAGLPARMAYRLAIGR
jgi:diadenosine tetraphosphatase ApaH/serine/threonine PP2A family protein phosphatase